VRGHLGAGMRLSRSPAWVLAGASAAIGLALVALLVDTDFVPDRALWIVLDLVVVRTTGSARSWSRRASPGTCWSRQHPSFAPLDGREREQQPVRGDRDPSPAGVPLRATRFDAGSRAGRRRLCGDYDRVASRRAVHGPGGVRVHGVPGEPGADRRRPGLRGRLDPRARRAGDRGAADGARSAPAALAACQRPASPHGHAGVPGRWRTPDRPLGRARSRAVRRLRPGSRHGHLLWMPVRVRARPVPLPRRPRARPLDPRAGAGSAGEEARAGADRRRAARRAGARARRSLG
jgi:hypothetical protein